MKYLVYNQEGKQLKETEIPEEIFGVPMNKDLIHQAVGAMQNNSRRLIAHTKDRSEVRGGGRKPWPQKGTGRARHGSTRSPIWIGGGVTFGPRKERNYFKKINKKMRKKALLMSLSSKTKDKSLILLDKLKINQPKTKELKQIFDNINTGLEIDLQKKGVLLVLPEKDRKVILSANNLPKTNVIQADSLNILEILSYKYLLMPKDSIDIIKKIWLY